METTIKIVPFSGFYESIWFDADTMYYVSEEEGKEMDIDFQSFKEEISNDVALVYQDMIKEYFNDIEFLSHATWSPRYYNFATDEIYLKANITNVNAFKVQMLEYIKKHKDYLRKLIADRFTSHDGYISFISNDIEEWKTAIEEMEKEPHEDIDTYISYLIAWVIMIEGTFSYLRDIDFKMYDSVDYHIILYSNITETTETTE